MRTPRFFALILLIPALINGCQSKIKGTSTSSSALSAQEAFEACVVNGPPVCVLKPGIYSGPLVLNAKTYLSGHGAIIEVPAGRDGLIVPKAASFSTIEGLTIRSVGTSSIVGRGVGLRLNAARLKLMSIQVEKFGRGMTCNSIEGGNCNGLIAIGVHSYRSDLEGVIFAGGDSSGVTTIGLDIKQACWRASGWEERVADGVQPAGEGWQVQIDVYNPDSGLVEKAWVEVPAGKVLLTGTVYRRPALCAALRDDAFHGNTHVGLLVHSTYTGGLVTRTKHPAFVTSSDNAWSVLINPYTEKDSGASIPGPLTTVVGGTAHVQPFSGWILKPQTALTVPVKYNGPLVLGGWDAAAPKQRIGFSKTAPVSTANDTWTPGDLYIAPGTPTCKIAMVTAVDAATGTVKTTCIAKAQ